MLSLNRHSENQVNFLCLMDMVYRIKNTVYNNLKDGKKVFIKKYENTVIVSVKDGLTVTDYAFYPINYSVSKILNYGERAVLTEKTELERQGF
jgi:hypothetical protein